MPQDALYGSRLIHAWKYDDENLKEGGETWTDVQGWSRDGKLKMRCCGVRARATRSRKGLKYFDHKRENPQCSGGEESPEHEHLKAEAMKTADKLGFEAWDEYPRGPGVPDVYIRDRKTGKQIAVEIQLSSQTGHVTRDRTFARASMGMEDTVWFFKHERNYKDVTLYQRHILPFLLPKGDVLVWAATLRAKLTEYLKGQIRFDEHSDLSDVWCSLVGYDFPCGYCGVTWYRTSFAALFPNRVRGDFDPLAIPIGRIRDPETTLRKSEQRIGMPTGKLVGSGLDSELVCPACEAKPEDEFLDLSQVTRAPLQRLAGKHNMMWKVREDRLKSAWRYPVPTYGESHFTETQWASIVSGGVSRIVQERARIAEQRRQVALEQQRALEREQHAAETRRLMAEREAAIDKKTATHVAEIARTLENFWDSAFVQLWMGAALPELNGMSMKEVIKRQIDAVHGTRASSRSDADRLLERILDPKDPMKDVNIRVDVKQLKELKAKVRKHNREKFPRRSVVRRLLDKLFA